MTDDHFGGRRTLAFAALFVLAHTQAPLFFSNQNQYLLHGYAAAGRGGLAEDWLANTLDPTPAFSAAVAFAVADLHPFALHAAHFGFVMLYFVSAAGLVGSLPNVRLSAAGRAWFAALMIAAHSAAVRQASVALVGVDYPWYLQCGLANQYVLGPGVQPSVFGVLLIASLAAFLRGRPALTGLCVGAAGGWHATYLLPGALLTAGYLAVLARERRWRDAAVTGAVALAGVLPTVVYGLRTFGPTEPAAFAEAQRLLAEVRIPHHAVIRRWLDGDAVLQMAWVALGIGLTAGTRLFPILAIAALGGAALSFVQAATGSHGLALLFPWRVSAVLVPVATAVILARLAASLPRPTADAAPQRASVVACWVIAVAFAAKGVALMAGRVGYLMSDDELPVMAFVAETRRPGDVYLLPAAFPKVGTGRGVPSTSFKPPTAGNQIPADLQRFRLAAGAAVYVDFKSIPYKDVEVLEWSRRLHAVQRWFADRDWGPETLAELRREGVTHVVTAADRDVTGPGLERVYADEHYRVYRVKTGAAAGERG